jgi:hypothetical protein
LLLLLLEYKFIRYSIVQKDKTGVWKNVLEAHKSHLPVSATATSVVAAASHSASAASKGKQYNI